MAERTEVARCPGCGKPIWSDHPYTWCSECGEPLPAEIRERIPQLRAGKAAAEAAREGRTTPLVVEGREVPCPVCGHERFWTRGTVMSGRGAALFDMEWAGQAAVNYVCDRCGHVLWFLRK